MCAILRTIILNFLENFRKCKCERKYGMTVLHLHIDLDSSRIQQDTLSHKVLIIIFSSLIDVIGQHGRPTMQHFI